MTDVLSNTTTDVIAQARALVESIGGGIIIWLPQDFPGDTLEEKQNCLNEHFDAIEDLCISRGNDYISCIEKE